MNGGVAGGWERWEKQADEPSGQRVDALIRLMKAIESELSAQSNGTDGEKAK